MSGDRRPERPEERRPDRDPFGIDNDSSWARETDREHNDPLHSGDEGSAEYEGDDPSSDWNPLDNENDIDNVPNRTGDADPVVRGTDDPFADGEVPWVGRRRGGEAERWEGRPTDQPSNSSNSSNSSAAAERHAPGLDIDAMLEFALFSGKPDATIFKTLLKDCQDGLGERYRDARPTLPDRYQSLAKAASDAMGAQDPDGSRAQVVKAIADFEGMRTHAGKAATKDSYHTERVEQLNKAGRAAIKEILAYVRKVATATSGDPPSHLMELLGIAEHVGRTVMEAEGSPYAWSLARLDAVATDDFATSGVPASTEQLRAWDLRATYKQFKQEITETANALKKKSPKHREFSEAATRAFDFMDRDGPPRDLKDLLKGKTTAANDEAIAKLAQRLDNLAFTLEAEAKGAPELEQLAARARYLARLLTAAMAAQLRG